MTRVPLNKYFILHYFINPHKRYNGIRKLDYGVIEGASIAFPLTDIVSVGVGGGSLVYANTLPVPKTPFYNSGTWAKLNDWETVLKPYYQTAILGRV